MNKIDLETLNGYLYETFKNRVRLNDNLDFEINYNTRLNSKLEAKIIVPEKFKKNYYKFYDYLLTSGVINEIISILYQFYLNDMTALKQHNNNN